MTDPTSRTTASYDRIAPAFAARTADPGPAYADFRHRFAAALPATSPVADLGCGPGRDARWFADQGIGVVGCDRSPAMARLATAEGIPTSVADLRHPPFGPRTLAGLWSSAALLHVPAADTESTLLAWREILSPGGVLGLTTSAGDTEGWEAEPYTSEGLPRWFTHRSPEGLAAALESAGFTVTELDVNTTHRIWIRILAQ